MKRTHRSILFVVPALVVTVVMFHVPIIRLGLLSFGEHGFSLAHYSELFSTDLYTNALIVTMKISLIVTISTLILGYPIAYVLASVQGKMRIIIALGVLIPFWSSILVRTYAWIYILARKGSVNDMLISLNLIDSPIRFMFNDVGVVIGMTNALLPFMVLTIYVSLQAHNKSLLDAAHSLGATPTTSFITVTLPLSRPGIYAGCLLVFATALGFFVTPALLGGGKLLMAATYISREIQNYVNWPLAAAASMVLLVLVIVVVALYAKIISVQKLVGLGDADA